MRDTSRILVKVAAERTGRAAVSPLAGVPVDGSGQNAPWASLAGSHSVNDPAGSNLIRLILQGSSDSTRDPTTTMPSFAAAYSNAEIAAAANYVINHFAGRNGEVTPSDVAKAR